MKPTTTEEVLELLDAYVTSAALGAAMEHKLFWILADDPKDVATVADLLGVTVSRCQNWLDVLCTTGLLELTERGYQTSESGKTLILDAYQPESWAFLARESRHRYPAVVNLAQHIKEQISTWDAQNLTPPDYFQALVSDPAQARRFTRMLYEIHIPLAEALAETLDMDGVDTLMDLGGGSGVMSLALLRKVPALQATVIDIENVCVVGREIAAEAGLSERISYQPLNFVEGDLPSGFDRVLFCDAGPYSRDLFARILGALNPDGRLILINQFAPEPGIAPPPRLTWAFMNALRDPHWPGYATAESLIAQLTEVGFAGASEFEVNFEKGVRWDDHWGGIEAWK